ncbi:MAG: DNA (cytosine-5-)-methyltransferase, partial [Abiotrophia defectiva]|nr:DNA (cytosine-5-)-methyltransferase [Abiotrophia defectiva]
MTKQLKVLELFAGVGGFRIGLENSNKQLYKTCWANQWEPARKSQDAFEVYNYRFPDSENIGYSVSDISDEHFAQMDADIIVGGFPCQDYSVARSKKNEQGIEGKKGVLFWEIIRATRIIRPSYLILENVDRLLKSPSKQRGRDFAIMLAAFNDLGYSVEWRVINAADYGRSQRRRRVFFFVYRNDTAFGQKMDEQFEQDDLVFQDQRYDDYIYRDGLFAQQFPIVGEAVK